MAQIFTARVWTAELRAEAQSLRDELLALDDQEQPPAPELPPARPRRAVADPAAEERRVVEREREAEAQRWRRVVAMRRGWGMSATVYDPERSAQRAAVRRQQREHTSGLVRDGFRPWR